MGQSLGRLVLSLDEKMTGGADALPPTRRLLDLISFVRGACDEEPTQMIEQMGPTPARAA
jgi:hypothetical protein